jgi:predicted NACHT family NTPase
MNLRNKTRQACLLLTGLLAIFTVGATTEKTVYSHVSNKELKQNSLQLAKNIRRLVDSYKKKDREIMTEYDRKDQPDMRKGGAHALRQQWLKDSDLAHDSTMRYYKDQYWADAILLIGELNRRLSKRVKQPELLRLYQHPTNVLGLAAIADHLELHSKLLPDS